MIENIKHLSSWSKALLSCDILNFFLGGEYVRNVLPNHYFASSDLSWQNGEPAVITTSLGSDTNIIFYTSITSSIKDDN